MASSATTAASISMITLRNLSRNHQSHQSSLLSFSGSFHKLKISSNGPCFTARSRSTTSSSQGFFRTMCSSISSENSRSSKYKTTRLWLNETDLSKKIRWNFVMFTIKYWFCCEKVDLYGHNNQVIEKFGIKFVVKIWTLLHIFVALRVSN